MKTLMKSKLNKVNSIESNMRKIIILLIAVIVFYPVSISIVFYLAYLRDSDIVNKMDWLSFFGSYGGGVIAGLGALLTIYFTLKYYRKKDNEQKEILRNKPILDKIELVKQHITDRLIIKDEDLVGVNINNRMKADVMMYNKIIANLKGYFLDAALKTLIGVLDARDKDGELYRTVSAIGYLQIPIEIRRSAEVIAELSLYKNCTDLLRSDLRLSYIIESEGGGSAGMWPYWWHTEYLSGREDIKSDLQKLFVLVDDITVYFDKLQQKIYDKIYSA